MMNGHPLLMALGLVTLALAGSIVAPARAEDIVIATDQKGTLYHQVGRAVCHFLRRHAEDLSCLPLPTSFGDTTVSIANLDNLYDGAVEFALVQADTQFHALNKSGPFAFSFNTYEKLRSVFSLYSEKFTLLAREDAGIGRVEDLRDHRVNIGTPLSVERQLVEDVMAANGLSKDDFTLTEELPTSQQSLAFCHSRVQAMVYVSVHPDATVRRVAEHCDAYVVPVEGPGIDKLVAENVHYTHASVPGGLYALSAETVATFGVTATLMSTSDVDPAIVHSVVKAVFDNFDAFKRAHPAFSELDPAWMVRDGLTAPLHDGALRYYQENGML